MSSGPMGPIGLVGERSERGAEGRVGSTGYEVASCLYLPGISLFRLIYTKTLSQQVPEDQSE